VRDYKKESWFRVRVARAGSEPILDNALANFYDLPRPGRVLRRRALLDFLVLGRSIPRSTVPRIVMTLN